MNRIILAALLAAGLALSAQAQTYEDSGGTVVPGVVPIQPGVGPLFTSANPGKISGSFSASLSGFQPTPSYASLSVGATSGRVALPSGTVVVVYNTGSNAAYVTIGGASVATTTSDDFVPAGGWMAFTVGSNTYLAAIETAGVTTLNLSGGSGLPTGACCAGGGASGGSNASVGSTGSAIPGSATLGGMSVGGTMTALPGTSNGLKVDGSAVTQPISASALPLPPGAATAANQTNVQSSLGSSASTALTVQGSASGVAIPVTGTLSASIGGFQPTPSYASLSVGATSGRVALPTGTVVVVYNVGSNPTYVTLGGSSVTATTSDDYVPAGGWTSFTVGSNTYLAAIENAGSTTLNLSGGAGIATGIGGIGSGGSGSNASVGSTGSAIPGSATLGGMSVSGTMTALPGTSNGLKVDGSAVTQPVSAATLPLPSGAATAANQTNVQASFGATAPSTGMAFGGRAENAEPTPVTNGQLAAPAVGVEGKLITLPYANKENMVRGSASQTGTSATTLIAAQGSGVKIYVTGVQCKNTGSTTTIVTLNDTETTGSGTVLIVPTSGGDNEVYQTPLAVAANTALTFTPTASSATIYCNAQGYAGS